MYFGPAVCVNELPAFQAAQVGGHCNGAAYLKVEQLLNENLAISGVAQSQYE